MRNADGLNARPNEDSGAGLVFAVSAYVLWGFLPLYLKALAHIPASEVVLHRVIWSVPVAGAVLIAMGRTGDLREALTSRRMLAMGCVTAALISINWGIYVWAIATERALDAALGYYINPLFSIFLGAVLLGERLNRAQMVAIALAAGAVLVLALDAGHLPWAAIGLMLSWGFYALAKKQLPIGPNQGFLLEALILTGPDFLACSCGDIAGKLDPKAAVHIGRRNRNAIRNCCGRGCVVDIAIINELGAGIARIIEIACRAGHDADIGSNGTKALADCVDIDDLGAGRNQTDFEHIGCGCEADGSKGMRQNHARFLAGLTGCRRGGAAFDFGGLKDTHWKTSF